MPEICQETSVTAAAGPGIADFGSLFPDASETELDRWPRDRTLRSDPEQATKTPSSGRDPLSQMRALPIVRTCVSVFLA